MVATAVSPRNQVAFQWHERVGWVRAWLRLRPVVHFHTPLNTRCSSGRSQQWAASLTGGPLGAQRADGPVGESR